MVILHPNILKELKSLEEIFSLEDLETICVQMMKVNLNKRVKVMMKDLFLLRKKVTRKKLEKKELLYHKLRK